MAPKSFTQHQIFQYRYNRLDTFSVHVQLCITTQVERQSIVSAAADYINELWILSQQSW